MVRFVIDKCQKSQIVEKTYVREGRAGLRGFVWGVRVHVGLFRSVQSNFVDCSVSINPKPV